MSLNQVTVQDALGLRDDELKAIVNLEEVQNIIERVAAAFDGDADKTRAWFATCNPMLAGLAPREMMPMDPHQRLLRHHRCRVGRSP